MAKLRPPIPLGKGSFDGPLKKFTPVGWVDNEQTNAEWRMQFIWPFHSAYLIAHLDADYQTTIIGVPNRKYLWIMARNPNLAEDQISELIAIAGDLGYDTAAIKRVPQSWPDQSPE